jgi:transcriptional regulator of aromatic amino acid metabolism
MFRYDRAIRRVGDRREVAVDALVRRLVVVGSDHERSVRAELFGAFDVLNRVLGGIRSGPDDHREAAFGFLHRDQDQFVLLVPLEGGRFARSAERHEAVDTRFDLEADEAANPS